MGGPNGAMGGAWGNLMAMAQEILQARGPGTAVMGDYASPEGFEQILAQLWEQQTPRHTPAAADAVSSLLREPVTAADVEAGADCPVCQEAFQLHEDALRMPCDHRFHPPCVQEWFKEHNTCPVCRYELPTEEPQPTAPTTTPFSMGLPFPFGPSSSQPPPSQPRPDYL